MPRSPSPRGAVTVLLFLTLASCQPPPPASTTPEAAPAPPGAASVGNPPAPGFDAAGSDVRAAEIADRVMERLGGRAAWDGTRYLTWRFFGGRRHVWDKGTGDLRYEDGELTVLTNIHDRGGRAWQGAVAVTDPDALVALLDKAYHSWINDSYWLVMPYKLKDTGGTLKYRGEEMTEDGLPAHVLELTFTDVGVTPQNRYRVWIDVHEGLVRQWAFYADAADEEPRFTLPWAGWQPYGRIWLNDDFGQRRHTELAVYDELPGSVFTRPEPVVLPRGGSKD